MFRLLSKLVSTCRNFRVGKEALSRGNASLDIIQKSPFTRNESEFDDMCAIMATSPWLEYKETELSLLWKSCASDEERQLVDSLLSRFQVYEKKQERECLARVVNHILHEWELRPGDTRLVAMAKDGESDGSQYFLDLLKGDCGFRDNKWKEKIHFISNLDASIPQVVKKWGRVKNIVLLDDFVGTGQKANREILKYKENIDQASISIKKKAPRIYFIAMAGMAFSINAGLDLLRKQGIDFFIAEELAKGISEAQEETDPKTSISLMQDMEKRTLAAKSDGLWLNQYSLGRNGSEALFWIRNRSISDNVFPIFWWTTGTGKRRKPLFHRAR